MMDPATIALIAAAVVEAVKAATKLAEIANNPASTQEQRAAALKGGNEIVAACVGLNAMWAAVGPKA